MINFTDNRLYSKGICSVELKDPTTGEILAQSDKFSEGNINFTANTDPLRAGMGNAIATIIASDSNTTVNFTRADTDLMTKMMSVGGKVDYNAVAPVCQTIKATGTTIKLDVSSVVPAAQYGYSEIFGYVQAVGEKSSYTEGGVPYAIDPATGDIKGFNAENGKTYKVWYFTKKAFAKVGTINGAFNGKIVHFTAQIALYTNVSVNKEGNLWGWRYVIVPRLFMQPDGANTTGSQNAYDTTVITGQGLTEDADVISAECNDCGGLGTVAYIVDVPNSESDEVAGIMVFGGVVSLDKDTKTTIDARLIMKDNSLVVPSPASLIKYEVTEGTATGTSVDANGVVTAGSTAGTGTITLSYPAEGTVKQTAQAILTVTDGG